MPSASLPELPTGLTALDRITSGGAPGATWLLSGPPGTPVCHLALTIARATALIAGHAVHWLSTRESAGLLAEAVVSAERHATFGLQDDDREDTERQRARVARGRLAASRLTFDHVRAEELTARAARLLDEDAPALLVLDEIDLAAEGLDALRLRCRTVGTWLVLIAMSPSDSPRLLRRASGSGVDGFLWCEHPDLHDPLNPRCGEADVTVYRKGRRPMTATVAHQGHLRRHVNIGVHPPYAPPRQH